jgi:hypothetical protein
MERTTLTYLRMWKSAAILGLLGIGTALAGHAAVGVPEIDPSTGVNAVALFAGALLVIRGRKR